MITKTKENLGQALAGESQAYFRYLGFAEKADQEGFPGVARLFKKALENPEANPETVYFVCPVCGYTVSNKPPKKCPYCGVDEKKLEEVN